MRLVEYYEHKLNEDGEGSGAIGATGTTSSAAGLTTSGSISYVPGGFKDISTKLHKLSKRKKNWKTDIVKIPEARIMKIEEAYSITIPDRYWLHFSEKMFNNVNMTETCIIINLSEYIKEALEDELVLAKEDLKRALISVFNLDIVKAYRHKAADIVKYSNDKHLNFSTIGNSLVTEPSVDRQVDQLLAYINKSIGNDLGAIQQLTQYIIDRKPLNTLSLFEKYDNLIGTGINGTFKGYQFNYKSSIDLAFNAIESLQFNDPKVIDKLKSVTGIKYEGNTFYPSTEDGLPYNFFRELDKILQEVK